MKEILKTLFSRKSLSRAEAERAMSLMISGATPAEQIAALLGALRAKGESLDELAGFASVMKRNAIPIPVRRSDLMDNCGTGGDDAGTFNISTVASFILAAEGVGVAKHGNRSISSKCGSADVLEKLGVATDLSPEAAARAMDQEGFAFLFAQQYHPALKHVGPVRKALGVRTVFNVLGPLANPAPVRRQLVGVYDPSFTAPMAEVLRELGIEEALVVSSEDGLDEISLSSATRGAYLKDGKVTVIQLQPEDAGLKRASKEALKGGDADENSRIALSILEGEKGPRRDVAALNAGAALWISGKAASLREGVSRAFQSLDSGRARDKLERLRRFGK